MSSSSGSSEVEISGSDDLIRDLVLLQSLAMAVLARQLWFVNDWMLLVQSQSFWLKQRWLLEVYSCLKD